MSCRMLHADCLDVLPTLDAGSVDAVVCDPPYGLEFMGKEWDSLTRNCMTPQRKADQEWNDAHTEQDSPGTKDGMPRRMRNRPDIGGSLKYGRQMQEWHGRWASAALRVLKPGGYMLAFGGTRTYHRLACAIEDAGFELRDCIMYMFGTGFPKGRGCLKPAYEPILLARKPGAKVLPLGIDECRVACDWSTDPTRRGWQGRNLSHNGGSVSFVDHNKELSQPNAAGRWPANIIHDGSEEVLEAFAAFGESKPKAGREGRRGGCGFGYFDDAKSAAAHGVWPADAGGTAARFFYTAKASRKERGEGNTHPTVKPLALMTWLVKLVAREGETVLDPFLGSGTTALACVQTGRKFIGIERESAYVAIARRRIAEAQAAAPLFEVAP